MKRYNLLLIVLLALTFSLCQKDEEVPVVDCTVTDVTTTPRYNGCLVTCRAKGIDNDHVHLRLLLSRNDSLQNATHYDMGVDGELMVCDINDLDGGTTYYFGFEAYTSRDSYRLESIYPFTTDATIGLSVTTDAVTDITTGTASCTGHVSVSNDLPVLEFGVCWDTAAEPRINQGAHHMTASGSYSSYTCTVTGLAASTRYYVCAYAINSLGTTYGNAVAFDTKAVTKPTVRAVRIADTNQTTATFVGEVTDDGGGAVTARGVYWSKTNSNPGPDDNVLNAAQAGSGEYACDLMGLDAGTTYHARAFATNMAGTSQSDNVLQFTTRDVPANPPSVTTSDVENITATSALLQGNVSSSGSAAVDERGFCWSTDNHVPTTNDNKEMRGSGTGSFSLTLTGLQHSTTYWVRAYAHNSAGTAYGQAKQFRTSDVVPSVTTTPASAITSHSATVGGNVTDNGGEDLDARGICYSATVATPTLTNGTVVAHGSTGTGTFSIGLTGLQRNTDYRFCAYATNSVGTSYGEVLLLHTPCELPTVTTATPVIDESNNNITCGGAVTDDGGGGIVDRGVCWSTSANPTTSGSHASAVTVTGDDFTCAPLSGLSAGTTYHVRAYATNSAGTGYGTDLTFTTPAAFYVGSLTGLFSVSATQQVQFSRGNLQYQASTSTWRFATEQYNIVDSASNHSISATTSNWIDLFGWSTSGYNGHNPHQTSSSDNYTNGTNDIAGTQYDWGVHNSISNGGNMADMWRTLTKDEWQYLLNTRTGASSKRGYATITTTTGSVAGLVLLPDTWSTPAGCTFSASGSNSYTSTQWDAMQEAGAVFLPAAGYRQGTSIKNPATYGGRYWTATINASTSKPYHLNFNGSTSASPSANTTINAYYGLSVRLVHNN